MKNRRRTLTRLVARWWWCASAMRTRMKSSAGETQAGGEGERSRENEKLCERVRSRWINKPPVLVVPVAAAAVAVRI